MKKIILITLLMCFISTITACGDENPKKENSKTTSETESVEDNTSEKETEDMIDDKEKEKDTSNKK